MTPPKPPPSDEALFIQQLANAFGDDLFTHARAQLMRLNDRGVPPAVAMIAALGGASNVLLSMYLSTRRTLDHADASPELQGAMRAIATNIADAIFKTFNSANPEITAALFSDLVAEAEQSFPRPRG